MICGDTNERVINPEVGTTLFNGSVSIHPDPAVQPTNASLYVYMHCPDSNDNLVYDIQASIADWEMYPGVIGRPWVQPPMRG